MLEAYAVGVKLEMTSNVSGVLDKVMRDVERFNVLVKESGEALSRMAGSLRSLGRAGSSPLPGIDKMADAMRTTESAAAGLNRTLRSNAEYASEAAKAMEASARAMTEANRANRSSGSAGHGQSRFSEHNVMMAGLGAGMVGAVMAGAVRSTLTPAIDLAKTRDVLAADMRLTPAEVDAATAQAREATKLAPGTTTGENLAAILDLKNVFGSLDEATKMIPEFARMTALFQVMDRKSGGTGEQSFAAAKAMEIMGAMVSETTDAQGHTVRNIDPELGMKHLLEMQRVAVATNMRVTPETYLGFAKQARVAGMTLTDEFTYEKLPAMLSVLGGQRVGTALMSMAQVFKGGKLTDKSMEALQAIGLASPGGITREYGRNGKLHDVVHPEAIYDSDLMMHDPEKYLEAAQKRMEAKGIHGTEAQITALMRASQRATIAGIFADLLKDMPTILKEQANIQNTRPDMAEHMAAVDPAAKVQQFEAALTNLATELGSAGMADAMRVLASVTAGLNAMTDWAHNNPGFARAAFDAGAGLAAIATGLGALSTAILVFGPALRLLGVAGGGSGAAGAAAGGGILARLGLGGLGLPGLAAGALGWLAYKGLTQPTSKDDLANRDLQSGRDSGETARRAPQSPGFVPQDGFGVDGLPVHKSAYYRGTGAPDVAVYLDGEVIYRAVQKRLGRDSNRPMAGRGDVDPRMNLLYST
jgi:hypothetical protein